MQNVIIDGCYLLFEESVGKKTIYLYPESVPRNRLKFRKKLAKNFEIFWMSNKTIIELGFHVKNYAVILEAVIHLGLLLGG